MIVDTPITLPSHNKKPTSSIFNRYDHTVCPYDLLQLTETDKQWGRLIKWPCLLFEYQMKHKEENIRIATVSSHKLNQHNWCEDTEKCWKVEEFIRKWK